jgi:23S rRNA pseudouridine2605 synthase
MRLRLQKYIAQAGVCSRRAAEELIKAGRVSTQSGRIAQIGDSIVPGIDRVFVDGKAVDTKEQQYVIYHKPPKVVCSRKDTHGRRTLYDDLPDQLQHLFYAGRLDYLSEGLLILTNDGAFKQRLTHPGFCIEKHYHVWVRGLSSHAAFYRDAVSGIRDGGDLLRAKKVSLISQQKGLTQLEIILTEGKYREIRRMVHASGGKVVRLFRLRVGDIGLNGLKASRWRAFRRQELHFVDQLLQQSSNRL